MQLWIVSEAVRARRLAQIIRNIWALEQQKGSCPKPPTSFSGHYIFRTLVMGHKLGDWKARVARQSHCEAFPSTCQRTRGARCLANDAQNKVISQKQHI